MSTKAFLATTSMRVLLYYGLYCFVFIVSDLVIVSVFTFFHFLLDHDMNTIENWLNRSTWEILVMAKVFALVFTSKVTKLNLIENIKYRRMIKGDLKTPTNKIWGLAAFLLSIFYAFIIQFGGGVNPDQFKEELFYSSFFGSFFFYFSDFLMLYILFKINQTSKEDLFKMMYISLLLFVLSSKFALPYLSKYYIFLMVHYITMYYLLVKDNLSDLIVYTLLIVSPLSSLYGIDIVWDNGYSLFSYQKQLPALGVIGIWGLGLGYYQYSKAE